MKGRRSATIAGGKGLACVALAVLLQAGTGFCGPFAEPQFSFGEGALIRVDDLAVSADGTSVVVSDDGAVRRYSLDGSVLDRLCWLSPEVYGQSLTLACSPNGDTYVLDYLHSTVTRVALDGAVSTIGRVGSGPGEFRGTAYAAFASDGSVYIADFGNNRIQHFSLTLDYLDEIALDIPADNEYIECGPDAIAVDDEGRIWIAWAAYAGYGLSYARIMVYAPDSTKLREFPVPWQGPGHWTSWYFRDMAFDAAGRLLLLLDEDPDTPELTTFAEDGSRSTAVLLPLGVEYFAPASDGSVYTSRWVPAEGVAVTHLSETGEILAQWGEWQWAAGNHLLIWPRGIALDPGDRALVSGGYYRVTEGSVTIPVYAYLYRYTVSGALEAVLGADWYPQEPEWFFALTPGGDPLRSCLPIAIDQAGHRYLIEGDWTDAKIVKVDSDGLPLAEWAMGEAVRGCFVGLDGFLYLTRTVMIGDPHDMLQFERYDLNGNLRSFWRWNAGWGGLAAVDQGGRCYLAATDAWSGVSFVELRSSSGELTGRLETAGREQLSWPNGVALSSDGRMAVLESNRVHIFQITPSRFPDIPWWFWAKESVEALAEAGIVSGYPGGAYRPADPVSRAQMAVYLARALAEGEANVPAGPSGVSFYDVPKTHWAYRHIEYCHAQGIVQGHFGRYYPEGIVDRGQMAIFLARALAGSDEAVPDPPDDLTFPDISPIGPSAGLRRYVEYLAAEGVVSGYPDGRYHPERVVTRDAMAAFIARGFTVPQ